ncbi:ubiquitin domain-containing protein UBFD1-like isoform X2 [Gigantopelta aegis]|uniref:ubiquitin domain-containing protein UBFD1-like isoform X2 n=1 Tax=Gigantopelta aegis TaxID=1735272 RepID=UPI001B88B526|nr:ubiquitin domain-containing protein UBFD1-like isoform X2 [Gigantopelta aegis]
MSTFNMESKTGEDEQKSETEESKMDVHQQSKIEDEKSTVESEKLKSDSQQLKMENENSKIADEKSSVDDEQTKMEDEPSKMENEKDSGVSSASENNIDGHSCSLSSTEKCPDPGGSTVVSESGNIVTQETDRSSEECIDFKIIYNKQKFDVNFPLDKTASQLKVHVQSLTGVPPAMQKLMFKGLVKDHQTLRELKVTKGAKVMVVGSTLTDVLSVSAPSKQELQEEAKLSEPAKEMLCKQKQHKKVLEKYGKPDDLMPGKKAKEPLPSFPIHGMYNKAGGKVRLTFKLELDQLWIGTKDRTDKLPMNSIKTVVSEPLDGHEEHHILGIQLGPTEASRYWVYWVPAQYVDAIKDAVLGKWQYF